MKPGIYYNPITLEMLEVRWTGPHEITITHENRVVVFHLPGNFYELSFEPFKFLGSV